MTKKELIEALNELSVEDTVEILKLADINIAGIGDEEKAEIIYKMFHVEAGGYRSINLTGLDFTKYNCNVYISHMKVNGFLEQGWQEAKGLLRQSNQKCDGKFITHTLAQDEEYKIEDYFGEKLTCIVKKEDEISKEDNTGGKEND